MRAGAEGLALIQHFEGYSARAYRCPAGWLTIGYGHLLQPGEPRVIDRPQAEMYLQQDVQIAERAVTQLITASLDQHAYDALVSFTFNLGSGALERSTLRRLINGGEVDAAADQFARWVYADGRKLPGLIRRRSAERLLFQGDEWRAAV